MEGSRRRGPRLFVLAIATGMVVFAAQSCAEKRPSQQNAVVAQPEAGLGPTNDDAIVKKGARLDDGGIAAVDEACGEGGKTCPEGFLCCPQCCLAGLPNVCKPASKGQCPLPDLSVDEGALATNMYLENVNAGECEMAEACLAGTGMRKVLRFEVRVPNKGPADLYFGNPDAGGRSFEYAECHKHFHFSDFAMYRLLNDKQEAVVVGRKQAFCAMDSARATQEGAMNPRYDCSNQGIQIGWADVYPADLPCQYLDITDVPTGTYWLEVHTNPRRVITETNYENNVARVKVDLP